MTPDEYKVFMHLTETTVPVSTATDVARSVSAAAKGGDGA
jgi:hypothetical protein